MEPSPARRAGRSPGAPARWWTAISRLPFADDEFRLATALDVLEHLDDDLTGLAELRRVVRSAAG